MKTAALITFTLGLILHASTSFASAIDQNSVESNLNNIRQQVRQCAVLPYHYNADTNNRVDQAIQSRCGDVKIIKVANQMPKARIKLGGHVYMASLITTAFSDGDVFDVQITDVATQDSFQLHNVLAFGDILLGVLGGSTNGITDQLISN